MKLKKIYNNLVKYDIKDDIAAYALYSNQNNINDNVIFSLIQGYDFKNNAWIDNDDRQFCINHLKNYCKKNNEGRGGHNNPLILQELKRAYPHDF